MGQGWDGFKLTPQVGDKLRDIVNQRLKEQKNNLTATARFFDVNAMNLKRLIDKRTNGSVPLAKAIVARSNTTLEAVLGESLAKAFTEHEKKRAVKRVKAEKQIVPVKPPPKAPEERLAKEVDLMEVLWRLRHGRENVSRVELLSFLRLVEKMASQNDKMKNILLKQLLEE